MNPRLILCFWLTFLLSVGVGSKLNFEISRIAYVIIILFLATLLLLGYKVPFARFVIAITLGFCLAILVNQSALEASEYQEYIGHSIDWQGFIQNDPIKNAKNQKVIIRPDGFEQYLQASLFSPINIKRGDKVLVKGKIGLPENFSEFDYVNYLKKEQIYAVVKSPQIIILSRSKASLRSALINFKGLLVSRVEKLYPDKDHASLVLGMLIGYKKTMPTELQESFRKTGLTHIVAVSGFNMTIIASSCVVLAWYIGRRVTNLATILLIISFVIITGASASVVRAAIMASLLIVAQLNSRLYSSVHALVWTAGLMVLQNPKILLWDVGFQLSFAATVGLLMVYGQEESNNNRTWFGSILRPTIAAIIMTAPLVVYYFGTLSLVALLANLLVLPMVPWIMLFSALSLVPIIGEVFTQGTNQILSIMIEIVRYLGQLPFSTVDIQINLLSTIMAYVLIWFLWNVLIKKTDPVKI